MDPHYSSCTLPSNPLFYVNHKESDYVCFMDSIHQVSFGLPSMDLDEIMDSDEDIFDIHKRSSVDVKVGKSKVVFKYKKPAIAFDSIVTETDRLLIFSLHYKRNMSISQTKSSDCTIMLFLEVTSFTDTFQCVQPCAGTFNIMEKSIPKTGWVAAVPADRVTSEFIDKNISCELKSSFERNGFAVFGHFDDDPNYLFVTFLNSDLTFLTNKQIEYLPQIFTKPFVLFDESIIINTHLRARLDHKIAEKTDVVLSLLFMKSNKANSTLVSIKDLKDVKSVERDVAVLDFEGAVTWYFWQKEELIKREVPIPGVAFVSLSSTKLCLLTKGGSLYHLTNLMQEFSSDLEPKCDANLDRIVEASENLKKLSKEQREAEEVLKQIKLLWEIERGSEKFSFDINYKVVETNPEYLVSVFQLVLIFSKVKEPFDESSFCLKGKYWHLLVTTSANGNHTSFHEVVAFPSSLESTWTTYLNLPQNLMRLDKLPVNVELRLSFSADGVSLPSAPIFHFKLTSLDFLFVKSATQSTHQGVNEMIISRQNESFEAYLGELNKSRAISFNICGTTENINETSPSFEVKLKKSLINSSKSVHLFLRLKQLLNDSTANDEEINACLTATLFNSEVSVVLQRHCQKNVYLTFSSKYVEALRYLKSEISSLRIKGITQDDGNWKEIPTSVVSRLVNLKHVITHTDLNESSSLKSLKLQYNFLRCKISTELP